MSSEVLDRFLKYVKIHTTSKIDVAKYPSSKEQFDLARSLVTELDQMGVKDISLDRNCIVFASIPSNMPDDIAKNVPKICLISHMDTSPDEPGDDVNPQVIDYNGGDIQLPSHLPGEKAVVITEKENPTLSDYKGSKIVTTDGTTLLGADDKAGIAEIMTAISFLMKNPNKPHGEIKLLFNPDEEVGRGVEKVSINLINADFAFTIDGGEIGELETECFNAANGTIEISGYNVHPGYAYGKMINAVRIAADVLKLFPDDEAPETTKDREGYYHPDKITGDVNSIKIKFLIRDFDKDNFEKRIKFIESGIKSVQDKYPGSSITLEILRPYNNMIEILNKTPEVLQIAEEAMKKAGIEIVYKPIRGGTDGSQLSFRGLPTPNVFTGGVNFHSKKEFIPVSSMEKAVETILNIIEITSKTTKNN